MPLRLAACLLAAATAGAAFELPLPGPSSIPAPPAAQNPADPFGRQSLEPDLQFLADDALQGRAANTFGGRAAALWVENRFRQLGLLPLHSIWQYPFSTRPLQIDQRRTRLSLAQHTFFPGAAFLPHPSAPPGRARGPLVFGGYGCRWPQAGYDDLEKVSVQGAVVVLLRFEPQLKQADSLFKGLQLIPTARLVEKIRRLEADGAVAVCLADPPGIFSEPHAKDANGSLYWPSFSPLPRALKARTETPKTQKKLAATNFSPEDGSALLLSMAQQQAPLGVKIPVLYISQNVLEQFFADTSTTAAAWVQQTNLHPQTAHGFPLKKTVELEVRWQRQSRSQNVIAYLPGSDSNQQHPWVVIGAHYDHLGLDAQGNIWNGADDNASGVVGLLALANYFTQEKHRPKRNLLFVAFGGEESGLLGSHAFLNQRQLDPEAIQLMVNLDQIGQAQKGRFFVLGTQTASGLEQIIRSTPLAAKIHLGSPKNVSENRSDQAPFLQLQIPALFFTTGPHQDYHTPQDTWERIDLESMGSILAYAAAILQQVANTPKTLHFVDYNQIQNVDFDQAPELPLPWPISFRQRLDY